MRGSASDDSSPDEASPPRWSCPRCRSSIPLTSRYCPECGLPISSTGGFETPPPQRPSRAILVPLLLAVLTTSVVAILVVLVLATGILSPRPQPSPTPLLTDAELAWCHASIANAQAVDDQIFSLFSEGPNSNSERQQLINRLAFTRIAGFGDAFVSPDPTYRYEWIDRMAEFEVRFPNDYARACRTAFALR